MPNVALSFALLLFLSACSGPRYYAEDQTKVVHCETGETLSIASAESGKRLTIKGAGGKTIVAHYQGTGIFEDRYASSDAKVWIDPEVSVTMANGRRIGECL